MTNPTQSEANVADFRTLQGRMMVDAEREQLFSSIGAMRGPFKQWSSWPSLSDAKPPSSYGRDDRDSEHDHNAVRRIDGRLWESSAGGETLALQFIARSSKAEFYTAVGVDVRDLDRELHGTADQPRQFRFSERGEQCLWALHQQILRQRSSQVQLPDIWLGRCVWGTAPDRWPANWRRELFDHLWSLEKLKIVQIFGSDTRGWQVGEASPLVAAVKDGQLIRNDDDCSEHCPLAYERGRHHHYIVHAGVGFLGILEHYKVADGPPRRYDFSVPTSDMRPELQAARSSGRIVPVSPLLKICGPLRKGPYSRSQRRLLNGLLREVTRAKNSRRSDKARIQNGDRVVGVQSGTELVCPLLSKARSWISFGGNGKRPGMGYRIVGQNDRGWLFKCGYATPASDAALSAEVRRFLHDLHAVCRTLDLVAVGLTPPNGRWLSLPTMTTLARGNEGWRNLDAVHVRVYGPVDYDDRLGDMLRPPMSNDDRPRRGMVSRTAASQQHESEQLSTEQLLTLSGISNQELARRLHVSEAFVSQIRRGRKAWPAARELSVRKLAMARIASTAARDRSVGRTHFS